MNISDKSFSDTLDFQVNACRRAVIEQPSLSVEDHLSICNAYIERLRGIAFAFISFQKAEEQANSAIAEIVSFRNSLSGDVGRSSTQSPAAVE